MSTIWSAKIANQNYENNLERAVFLQTREPCVIFGTVVLFSNEEYQKCGYVDACNLHKLPCHKTGSSFELEVLIKN